VNASSPPEVDLEMLMRRVREDVQHRRAAMGERRPVSAARSELPPLPRLAESAGIIERKQEYSLEEFLYFNDEDFIRNAYRGMLQREPDAKGSGPFREGLRTGQMAKVEILGRIRYSAEGRACGVDSG
jgi:O-antigen chain-terminating methyltransferase